eukprot:m.483226 g.483226  ORF g.483226 m.483226 type:complete len:149 (-) comp63800_c0_seq1:118-564(-)
MPEKAHATSASAGSVSPESYSPVRESLSPQQLLKSPCERGEAATLGLAEAFEETIADDGAHSARSTSPSAFVVPKCALSSASRRKLPEQSLGACARRDDHDPLSALFDAVPEPASCSRTLTSTPYDKNTAARRGHFVDFFDPAESFFL